ncbi:MAG: TIGR00341 family protein [Halioglobus sp.]
MKLLRVDEADIERMAKKVVLSYGPDSTAKISQFWILLTLAGIIATAGVAADSVATVIGAMIVAPLMTPILGVALALVISDRHHLMHSLCTVLGGALLVVSIAFLFSMVEPMGLFTEGNSQVMSRTDPRLIDLIAALATGMVGAFALVRSDISDTLPGVAIAISLVPPLAVAGLTLQDGKTDEALGALLLFITNVTAIIFTSAMILLLYKVRETAKSVGFAVGTLRGWSLVVVVSTVILVAIPLFYGTQKVFRESVVVHTTAPLAEQWAQANGWKVINVEVQDTEIFISAFGPPPELAPESLRESLNNAGFADLDLTVQLVVGGTKKIPGNGQSVRETSK